MNAGRECECEINFMSGSKACEICGNDVHPLAYLCKRCKDLINRGRKANKNARIQALKQVWDKHGFFRCYYSKVRLVEDNPEDPRYLTFDHRTPRQEDDIVVAAALVNDMKSDMSEDEFKNMILQLANSYKGGTFDESVFNVKHWKRHA